MHGLALVTCHVLFNDHNRNLVVLLSDERVEAKVFEEDENESEVSVVGDDGLVEHGLERVNMLAALGGHLEEDGFS